MTSAEWAHKKFETTRNSRMVPISDNWSACNQRAHFRQVLLVWVSWSAIPSRNWPLLENTDRRYEASRFGKSTCPIQRREDTSISFEALWLPSFPTVESVEWHISYKLPSVFRFLNPQFGTIVLTISLQKNDVKPMCTCFAFWNTKTWVPLIPSTCLSGNSTSCRLLHWTNSVATCSECGGAVKVIACIEDPVVIRKILKHLDKIIPAQEVAGLPESRAPPQAGLFE